MGYKFSTIEDAYSCPIDVLEKEVDRLTLLGDFFETKQLALKKFINSVYGATASKYFVAHNTLVAESITSQGQDLNHFSENSVNAYFNGIFQKDTELHKALGISTEDAMKFDISKGKTTDTGPLTGDIFNYLDGDQSMTVAGDTDSCSGDTLIYLNGIKMPIEEAFKELKYDNNDVVINVSNGSEVVPVKDQFTNTVVEYNGQYLNTERPINYIMRHKVSKARFKIKTKSGKEVIVTGDHSCMVLRDGNLIEIKAADINAKSDKLVTMKN